MTYTISTEPVTEEHIGRRVLVKDSGFYEKAVLLDVIPGENGAVFYLVVVQDSTGCTHQNAESHQRSSSLRIRPRQPLGNARTDCGKPAVDKRPAYVERT